jgi:hypothetical protein
MSLPRRFTCCGVARNRNGNPHQVCPPRCSIVWQEDHVFIIGIDPHKGSHTAAVIDRDEALHAQVVVCADRGQRAALLSFAAPFMPRVWAVEGATGVGALLAQ